jgi:hypothetical protein
MRLVDERTNSFVEDPSNSKEIKYRATTEEKVPYKVLDSEARAELDKKSQVAADAYAERRATALELKQRMPEFGVAKHDDINSAAKLQDLVDQKTQEIARDNSLDAAQKREKLERLATMESLAQQYNAQLSTAKNLSKEMGDIGTVANILDPVARPGAVLLTPFDGFFDGSNTIDVGAFLPAREAGPGDPGREPTFVINEAKGGTSRLGYAETPNGRTRLTGVSTAHPGHRPEPAASVVGNTATDDRPRHRPQQSRRQGLHTSPQRDAPRVRRRHPAIRVQQDSGRAGRNCH